MKRAMRSVQKIMEGWEFTDALGEKKTVDLPHTWNGTDGQDGGNDYFRGRCVYEKQFGLPAHGKEERVYLQFHGVNASARVLLNQKEVCVHDNGYSTFRADVTELLRAENKLRVEVDNGVSRRVYPQKADFTFYGGIYRDVELLTVCADHFELDDYGGQGVWVDTKTAGGKGLVRVRAFVHPGGGDKLRLRRMQVALTLLDASGSIAAETVCKLDKRGACEAVLEVPGAHLWQGIKDPYLYTLKAALYCDGRLADEIGCSCGIRTFSVDPEQGFFLNGARYPLRGVSRHQDWRGVGNALSDEQMERDMELIREVGANTIRLAHYQHSQYFYELCDRFGMVVWAEIPYISEHMPQGRENTLLQMRELITQNYNHPCIVTWGISNEITISRKHRRDMLKNHRELQRLCKRLDPARPTTLACYAMCSPFHPVTKITDLVAWNLYLGWYVPGLFFNDLFFRFYHFLYPKRCLGYSEYGAEGMPNLHAKKPRRGDHTEEYQAKYHEYMLNCFSRYPFLWATYVWNMFDFAADARDQGGEPGMNHKGLVTFDRTVKKDSFYIYKAWWSDEPFVHLSGRRYEYRTGRTTAVTVYSNQGEVSLYNNGRLVGTKRGAHAFHFKLRLEKENHLEALAGEWSDSAVIYRTKRARPEYKVKKSNSQNWV